MDELSRAGAFDTVLISELREGRVRLLSARRIGPDAEATLEEMRARELIAQYPTIEAEVVRDHVTRVAGSENGRARHPRAIAGLPPCACYVVAPLTLDERTVGLLHAGRAIDTADEADRELVAQFARGVSRTIEVLILRAALGTYRGELERAVTWLSAQLEGGEGAAPRVELRDPLTRRERDVIELLRRGYSNRAIAAELVLSEGTVKYHVKNILQKLGATNRADAVARFLRPGA